jgi:hypothetical protein
MLLNRIFRHRLCIVSFYNFNFSNTIFLNYVFASLKKVVVFLNQYDAFKVDILTV